MPYTFDTTDGKWQPIRQDRSTWVVPIVEYAHHEAHDGSAYLCWDRVDLVAGTKQDYAVITPDTTEWGHFVLEATSEAEACVQLYEEPTITSNGTALTAYNRNRNSTNDASILCFKSPTGTAAGDVVLFEDQWGSGKQLGGGPRGLEEWLLKQNNTYLIRFTNLSNGVNFLSVHLTWYEHTDKTET